MTIRLLAAALVAAIVSGCAASADWDEDECWRDRDCRRSWQREERLERAQKRKRYVRNARRYSYRDARKDIDDSVRDRRSRKDDDRRDGSVCQPRLVVATGEKALSQENAEIFALRIWKSQVAFEYGEQYLDFHRARRPRLLCAPVGIADTISGKIKEKWLGVTHWRCRVEAYPCKGRAEDVSRDD